MNPQEVTLPASVQFVLGDGLYTIDHYMVTVHLPNGQSVSFASVNDPLKEPDGE